MTATTQAPAAAPPRLMALRKFAREFATRPTALAGLAILVAIAWIVRPTERTTRALWLSAPQRNIRR